jgi:hypothetical protein
MPIDAIFFVQMNTKCLPRFRYAFGIGGQKTEDSRQPGASRPQIDGLPSSVLSYL